MASNIDPSVFPDNQPVDKQDLRDQLEIAKDEITALQALSTPPQQQIRDDNAWNTV